MAHAVTTDPPVMTLQPTTPFVDYIIVPTLHHVHPSNPAAPALQLCPPGPEDCVHPGKNVSALQLVVSTLRLNHHAIINGAHSCICLATSRWVHQPGLQPKSSTHPPTTHGPPSNHAASTPQATVSILLLTTLQHPPFAQAVPTSSKLVTTLRQNCVHPLRPPPMEQGCGGRALFRHIVCKGLVLLLPCLRTFGGCLGTRWWP